jgi:hypothetical protein
MATTSAVLNSGFRPETYWPESRTPEQLLANIKGKVRRDIARRILAEEGFAGLNALIAQKELEGEDLFMWGRVHPAMMGGEYLPPLGEGEVEIARISLASTTGDQISIRACREDGATRYAVVDEYESTFQLSVETSEAPPTLGELIGLIDESSYHEDSYSGGLVVSHLKYNLDAGSDVDELEGFVSVESAFYPELSGYYQAVLDRWLDEHRIQGEE